MKKYVGILCLLALLPAIAIAGMHRWYVRSWPGTSFSDPYHSQAYDAAGNEAGVTMAQLGTGVSLIGVINNVSDAVEGVYTLEPGSWLMGYDEHLYNAGTAGTQSTGTSGDGGVTISYRYGLSNRELSTAQWEALTQSGTTLIGNWLISGTSHPVEFFPEPAQFVGIFAAVPGGSTQFCVPRNTLVVYQ